MDGIGKSGFGVRMRQKNPSRKSIASKGAPFCSNYRITLTKSECAPTRTQFLFATFFEVTCFVQSYQDQ